jgi:hypothetical protein
MQYSKVWANPIMHMRIVEGLLLWYVTYLDITPLTASWSLPPSVVNSFCMQVQTYMAQMINLQVLQVLVTAGLRHISDLELDKDNCSLFWLEFVTRCHGRSLWWWGELVKQSIACSYNAKQLSDIWL